MTDKSIIEKTLRVLAKTKELIFYAVQLTDAVQRGTIRPEHFESNLIVPEPHTNNGFHISLDWSKFPEIFLLTADDAQVHIASYAIIICKESYPKSLWVEESSNPDLYSAQMILKLIRDALGHMCANSNEAAVATWSINKKDRRIFEIKKINISLDARHLHDQQFKFSPLGGLSKALQSEFLKICSQIEKLGAELLKKKLAKNISKDSWDQFNLEVENLSQMCSKINLHLQKLADASKMLIKDIFNSLHAQL